MSYYISCTHTFTYLILLDARRLRGPCPIPVELAAFSETLSRASRPVRCRNTSSNDGSRFFTMRTFAPFFRRLSTIVSKASPPFARTSRCVASSWMSDLTALSAWTADIIPGSRFDISISKAEMSVPDTIFFKFAGVSRATIFP